MKVKLILASALTILAITAGACSSIQGTSGLEDKKWVLDSYGPEQNRQKVLYGTEITATFEGGKNKISGSAGVNTYSGTYRISGENMSIQELSWTEMYRDNPPGIMEQETNYLNLLQSVDSFSIQNNQLKITAGEQVLIFYEGNTGILQGIVTIGPITPVERPGEIPTVPPEIYEARKVMVFDKSGEKLIQQIDIDNEGRYIAHLKPGTYTVDINHIGMDSSSEVPQKVEIQSGITIRLDIAIDTGIR